MDTVFKALADPTRRALLDRLTENNGQSLGSLCRDLEVSRQAVSKHLQILEAANLVVTKWSGREKLHYLNPVPIQEIADRWISRFAADRVAAITAMKKALEEEDDE
jgi:DNA-binding transcriptional ArsR family regulator